MFSYRVPVLSFLAAAVLLVSSACGGSSVLVPGDAHSALLKSQVTGSSPGGAGFIVPAGTTVTSNSVMNGQITLGVQDLTSSIFARFDGTAYGGAMFTPTDASFSDPVELSIPVEGLLGDAAVYFATGVSSASQTGFSLHTGGLQVSNGMVRFSSSKFGIYIVGTPAGNHNEGSAGSL
jgi:hypothetical protein